MKIKITFLLVLITHLAFSQDLPINPQTKLVFIKDSIEIKNKSVQEIQDVIIKWGFTLLDADNLKAVYKLSDAKQTEIISISLPIGVALTQNKGGNKYLTNGSLGYGKAKTNGLNRFAPTVVSGGVKFAFYYTVTKDRLIYEFTNLEYSHDGVHFGNYEDEKPPQDNYNASLFIKMGKKEWQTVRVEYFDRVKILSENFRAYITNLLATNSTVDNQSVVNYDTYKKITTGMAYSVVSKMFGDDGKELSSSSSQVGGKTVSQQTIVWHDLDKSKNITVTFIDGRVTSKSQQNL